MSAITFLIAVGIDIAKASFAAFAKSGLSRTKTDKADAKLIACFALAMRPPAWVPPPPEIRELQALLRRIESLQEMQRTGRTARIPPTPPSQAPSKPCWPPWKRKSRPSAPRSAAISTAIPASSAARNCSNPSPASASPPGCLPS